MWLIILAATAVEHHRTVVRHCLKLGWLSMAASWERMSISAAPVLFVPQPGIKQ